MGLLNSLMPVFCSAQPHRPSIGFMHPGDRLNLRYDAFPYQEFGQAKGTILSISHGALTPSEVAGLTESRTDDPLYQVLVNLDHQTVEVYGRPVNLLAGLKLEAGIKVDRRRLIEWIFEPLLESGRNLLGESQS
jgi:membrane fusion protein